MFVPTKNKKKFIIKKKFLHPIKRGGRRRNGSRQIIMSVTATLSPNESY
jgi:hypothetical protein